MAEGYWRRLARNLAVAAAAGGFLAIVNAFDMGEAPLAMRLAYWVPLMMIGALLGGVFASLGARVPLARENPWLLGALITLGLTIVGSGFIWIYTGIFWLGGPPPASAFPYFFFTVLIIAGAMTAIMIAINRPGVQTHAAPAGAAPVRFLDRMPAKLRGAALYAVQAEDHYLRLHTSKGGDLILMRLSDAVAELEGLEGAQTHRSWWVARDAVEDVVRDGPRVMLKLRGGAQAPVSRPNIRALREAGWL
ncbi:MAG: hypothetical protein GC206_10710 [Alphaproteobacteria bacterium]|nr:hypothetical protein [Alphaproteobacteria bacterium]